MTEVTYGTVGAQVGRAQENQPVAQRTYIVVLPEYEPEAMRLLEGALKSKNATTEFKTCTKGGERGENEISFTVSANNLTQQELKEALKRIGYGRWKDIYELQDYETRPMQIKRMLRAGREELARRVDPF